MPRGAGGTGGEAGKEFIGGCPAQGERLKLWREGEGNERGLRWESSMQRASALFTRYAHHKARDGVVLSFCHAWTSDIWALSVSETAWRASSCDRVRNPGTQAPTPHPSSEHRQPEIKPEAGTDTQLTGQQPRPSHPHQPGAPCAALALAPCQGAAGRVSCTTRAPLTASAPSVDTFQRFFFFALQISAGQLSGILVAFILIRILRG